MAFLRSRLGFGLWMVTRQNGADWIMLQTDDEGYGVKRGDVFSWEDSFCSKMVLGKGPRVAPDSDSVPAYKASPIANQVKIGAYIGVPLTQSDGSLFGTLCAIDPKTQPETITNDQPLVELLADLLSGILASELKNDVHARELERAHDDAMTDVLTGVLNRRGWERLLDLEESRCATFGHSASVVSVDLDGLKRVNDTEGHASGDLLIQNAAQVLSAILRKDDAVARLGGDEFGVLLLGIDKPTSEDRVREINAVLAEKRIAASVGLAVRNPSSDLREAWVASDHAMYERKRQRKGDHG